MTTYVIDEAAVRHNIALTQQIAGVPVIAVVKGNGYGLGLSWLAEQAYEGGIRLFAITEISDIPALREAIGPHGDILMLRSTAVDEEAAAIAHAGCIASIGSTAAARALNEAAATIGVQARAHIKLDCGLGRYGFFPDDLDAIAACFALKHVTVEGIYSHFSQASAWWNKDKSYRELDAFNRCIAALESRGYSVGMRHMANSPALLNIPEAKLDAVRAGSAFTGRVVTDNDPGLIRVGFLEAPVIDLKHFPKDTPMGYGGAFKTKRDTTAAIVPIGTQDGFGLQVKPLSDLHQVLAAGKRLAKHESAAVAIGGATYPVLGVVDMSLSMVDVTDSPVAVGETAVVDINPLLVSPRVPRSYRAEVG